MVNDPYNNPPAPGEAPTGNNIPPPIPGLGGLPITSGGIGTIQPTGTGTTPGLIGPPPTVGTGTGGVPTAVVPGTAKAGTGQINIVDYAGQLVNNPAMGLNRDDPNTPENESMWMADRFNGINENATGTNIDATDPRFQQGGSLANTAATANTALATGADPQAAQTYQNQMTQDEIAANGQMTAQQGQVSQNAQVQAEQLDMQGTATGTNADGSTNYTGQALNQHASQNFTNIIDTSTAAGKALAQALGEGNYTDSKATLQGQMQMLQEQFVGPDGQPKIPTWAAGTARAVSKIAAFKGMTGTAATAAMSQAIMEASIPIAQQDAQFFQTLTLQNLSNKQAATINKANVLAKFDLANMDARMVAAVENSKAFLAMDMKNLDNKQQAEILNTQARIQSILEDAKSTNAQRLFTAEAGNDFTKFYDSLNSSISQFNASQTNGMSQFNASETNAMAKFNDDMENNREQFYKSMQYNIDLANAKWRQQVTMQEAAFEFEANATDVKNMVNLSTEQLNRIWDRSDSLLDYLWQSTEKQKDRNTQLALAKMGYKAQDKAGLGSIFGTILGNITGSDKFLDWLF